MTDAKYAKLCQHGKCGVHFVRPEGARRDTYLPAHAFVRCEGGTEFEVDWTAAYAAGEWMDGYGIPDFEQAVEDIVNAALPKGATSG